MMTLIKNNKGFTLVEILVALTIDFVILAGIYAAFYSQQKSHVKEQQVVDAQQNVRGSAAFMAREIRLAGMDRQTTAVAGIEAAGPHSVQFTLDRNEDDDVMDLDENIKYGFSIADDADENGIADAGSGSITRFSNTDATVADHIHAIAFAYAYDDDRDGVLDFVDAAPFNGQLDPGEEIWAYDSPDLAAVGLDTNNATGAALTSAISYDRIRAVRIWILARTRNPLRYSPMTKSYMVGDKSISITDDYQYRLLTTTVKCRNMGI
jgi:type IV pilus assembly protein PilW